MERDELDDILCGAQEVAPSDSFLPGVMAAIEREASTPPPIPFPWKRIVPAWAAGAGTFATLLTEAVGPLGRGAAAQIGPDVASFFNGILEAARSIEGVWIATALALVLASVKFSMRLTGARS